MKRMKRIGQIAFMTYNYQLLDCERGGEKCQSWSQIYCRQSPKNNHIRSYNNAVGIPITYNFHYSFMSVPISKARLCLFTPSQAHILAAPVANTLQASNTFLLSLANYLSKSAELYPESIMTFDQSQSQAHSSRSLPPHKAPHYLQIWCDYLFKLLSENQLMQIRDEGVLFASVSEEYLEYALTSQLFTPLTNYPQENNIKTAVASSVFKTEYPQLSQKQSKKILIINLSQSVTNTDKTKTKINVDCLFSGMYYRSGDQWQSYKILLQQIPTVQQLVSADTVLISGSTYSVNNMHPYMKVFQKNLVQALKVNQKLKVSGFCFGHQLVAHAFGGRVQKKGLIRGPEAITSKNHNLGDLPYMSDLTHDQTFKLKMYEYHSDYVVSVPQGFVSIGSSNSCQHEMIVSKDKRIFTFQFHPQYLVEYIRSVERRWNSESGFKGIHQNTDQIDQEHHQTSGMFRKVLRNFIDWEVGTN